MKTINIYLTQKEKSELDIVRRKYKISLSTIADKVCFYFYKYIKAYPTNEENLKTLMEKTDITNKYKTSIKPKCFKEGLFLKTQIESPTIFISNILSIYINKLVKFYINEEGIQQFYNEINREFTATREQFYDYNNAVRNQTRAIRMNKEYYKRILEE